MLTRSTTTLVKACQLIVMLLGASIALHATAQPFEQVGVGAAHICALDNSGQIECTATPIARRFLPPDDLPLLREIVAGQQHSCGVTLDGNIQCFGGNLFGELDPPPFNSPVIGITAGFNHNCAIDSSNQVQCWGLNTNGQLDVPVTVGGFVKVDAARTASCGIDTSGDIHCWSTDTFFQAGTTISGPFIDLDIDSNAACALTANGDIECFAIRERQNLTPPTNGPYTDLTVTNSAICGLRTDQFLDCSFPDSTPSFFDAVPEQYPTDIAFSSIERSAQQFGGVPICGIRADDGTISCFGDDGSFDGELPAPPGSADGAGDSINASNIILSLTAQVAGQNQVEVFWNRVPAIFPPISVEVFRDDELLTTTPNGFSFYDDDPTVTAEESRYRIRTVDDLGNIGQFSNTVIVNRITQEVTTGIAENPRLDNSLRVVNLVVNAFGLFNDNTSTFLLSWDLDNPSSTPIAGFEIQLNNEVTGFTSNTVFSGDGVSADQCTVFSVAAIGNDGEILDFRTAAFGRSATLCPR